MDDIINPKKKDHNNTGSLSKRYIIILESETILIAIPVASDNKNDPLICFQKSFILNLNNNLNASAFIEFNESTNSS